jgi:hypothetical protein
MSACTAEDSARTHQNTQDLSQQQHPSFHQSSITQSVTAPGSPQWDQEKQEIQEGNRSEISGYVPSHVTEPYPRALHNSQETQRSNWSSFIESQTYQGDYNNYLDPSDQPRGSPTLSSYQRLSPRDMQYQPEFFEDSWNPSTGNMSSEANPG